MLDRGALAETAIVCIAMAVTVLCLLTCETWGQTRGTTGVVDLAHTQAAAGATPAPATLADRAIAWLASHEEGRWRLRERGVAGWIGELAGHAEAAAAQPLGTWSAAGARHWPDAELLLALAWRESRWRPGVRGARGERGLAQLHPRYHHGDLEDPRVNLSVAAHRLAADLGACGTPGRALVRYGSGKCGEPGHPERWVLRIAERLR